MCYFIALCAVTDYAFMALISPIKARTSLVESIPHTDAHQVLPTTPPLSILGIWCMTPTLKYCDTIDPCPRQGDVHVTTAWTYSLQSSLDLSAVDLMPRERTVPPALYSDSHSVLQTTLLSQMFCCLTRYQYQHQLHLLLLTRVIEEDESNQTEVTLNLI